jgi:hypothetical protein
MPEFIRINFHTEIDIREYEIQPSSALYALFYDEAVALFDLKEKFEPDVIEQFRPGKAWEKGTAVIHDPYEAFKFWAKVRNFLRKKAGAMGNPTTAVLEAYFSLSFCVGEIHGHLEHAQKEVQKIEILFIPG